MEFDLGYNHVFKRQCVLLESRTKFLLSASEIYRHEHVHLASAFMVLAISTAIPCQQQVSVSLCLFVMVPIIEQWLQLAGWTDLAAASLLMTSLGMDGVCGMPGDLCHQFSTVWALISDGDHSQISGFENVFKGDSRSVIGEEKALKEPSSKS